MQRLKPNHVYKLRNSIIFSLPDCDSASDESIKLFDNFKKISNIYKGKVFILELSNVLLMDSETATELFMVWSYAAKNDIKVIFSDISSLNLSLLRDKGFDKLFEITVGLPEAVSWADSYIDERAKMDLKAAKIEEMFGSIHQNAENQESKLYKMKNKDKKLKNVS